MSTDIREEARATGFDDLVYTVEELDVLPNDTVIVDSMGDVGVVHGEHVWYPESAAIRRSKVAAHYLPARVLYRPAALGGGDHE